MNNRIGFIKKHFSYGFKSFLVGSIGAAESLILQYLLTEYTGIHYILSAIIGIGISFFNNYFLNYYYTFKIEEKKEES